MNRTPYQGLWTVVRFNWHFFAIAGAAIVACAVCGWWLPAPFSLLAWISCTLAVVGVGVPLLATAYAYDRTGLYQLRWLDSAMEGAESVANIHAGFDETTALLRQRYPIRWQVFDFYDPAKHTEISIRRARASATPDRETVAITTAHLTLSDASLDRVLLILAAHEIRDPGERAAFFHELRRVVKPGGRVIVVEHTRDLANVLAYGPGAWHFHTRAAWSATFRESGWNVVEARALNRLITCFVLAP